MNTQQHLTQFSHYLKYRRYSPNTIKTYTDALGVFFQFHSNKEPVQLGITEIIHFNTGYILRKNLSASYQNQVINAIKLFYRNRFNRVMDLNNIQRPRREKRLPNVLSKQEIKAIIEAPANIKHRAMLSLIYACGLRRSELLNLTLSDVLSDRNLLFIRQSKGKKDRVVPISHKTIEMLRDYYKAFKPKTWLFEGQYAGYQYSERSLQLVLKQA